MDVSVNFCHKSGLVPYLSMLSKAHNYLGKLEMTSELIPDIKLFFLIKVKNSLFSIKKNSSLWMIHFLLF